MIFYEIIFWIFCLHTVKCQSTFGPLSTAAMTTQAVTTKVTFGPLSTLSSTTTVKPTIIQICLTNICANGGQCFVVNGVDLTCSCLKGFTGIKLLKEYENENKFFLKVHFVKFH